MKRFLPAVLAPYGIPLKTLMPRFSVPRTRPNVVSTSTACVCAQVERATLADSAAASEPCTMKSRRDCRKRMARPLLGRDHSRDAAIMFFDEHRRQAVSARDG